MAMLLLLLLTLFNFLLSLTIHTFYFEVEYVVLRFVSYRQQPSSIVVRRSSFVVTRKSKVERVCFSLSKDYHILLPTVVSHQHEDDPSDGESDEIFEG
jgi:hypothetical protein